VFFFFFQAEDGIRDFHVTGVQTCALPIYPLGATAPEWVGARTVSKTRPSGNIIPVRPNSATQRGRAAVGAQSRPASPARPNTTRSEERRVGAECQYTKAMKQEKKIRHTKE